MGDVSGGTGWVIAVNLVLWTGLFLYLLRLERQVRRAERTAAARSAETGAETRGEMMQPRSDR